MTGEESFNGRLNSRRLKEILKFERILPSLWLNKEDFGRNIKNRAFNNDWEEFWEEILRLSETTEKLNSERFGAAVIRINAGEIGEVWGSKIPEKKVKLESESEELFSLIEIFFNENDSRIASGISTEFSIKARGEFPSSLEQSREILFWNPVKSLKFELFALILNEFHSISIVWNANFSHVGIWNSQEIE